MDEKKAIVVYNPIESSNVFYLTEEEYRNYIQEWKEDQRSVSNKECED